MNANDIETVLRARAAFNGSIEHIDADTRRRLRELRLQALHGKPRPSNGRWMWPAGAALTAAFAVILVLRGVPHPPSSALPAATSEVAARPASSMATVHPAQTATSKEIVASDPIEAADPDMLSDLDFYGWLARQPSTDATGG